ncbi:MAG: ribonuclease P protein component [Planctomycetota bacterium]
MKNDFPKTRRVRSGRDFTLVLRRGGVAADGCLVVFTMRNNQIGRSRLGVTIPKRTGNAVHRNRWKRWIRESFRTQQHQLPSGFDFVVRPKKGAKASWASIEASLPRLAQKAIRRLENASRSPKS